MACQMAYRILRSRAYDANIWISNTLEMSTMLSTWRKNNPCNAMSTPKGTTELATSTPKGRWLDERQRRTSKTTTSNNQVTFRVAFKNIVPGYPKYPRSFGDGNKTTRLYQMKILSWWILGKRMEAMSDRIYGTNKFEKITTTLDVKIATTDLGDTMVYVGTSKWYSSQQYCCDCCVG